MTYVRWTFRITLLLIVAAFLHYTLPQRDIVRIVNTYEERQDFGGFGDLFWKNTRGATADAPATRDVLFIQTVKANGKVMVYRNQDTGLGWPPYLKFDTANLQTEASDAVSNIDNPKWVALRHYGWRNTWLFGGIFPNALSMKPVSGPDAQLVPWFNIVFLTVLAVIWITLWRLWRNFRARRIDPVLEDIDEAGDAARGRVSGFFDRLRGRR
ncbi:MAG: DUF1523 family protein [Silicimonas sp.]|jgi:hypothetical protein|nr:DUF1523 family protein [Silicimonas sp.]